MKLDWQRLGVVRATLKVEELAALVAGARPAAAARAAQDQADELERVLGSIGRSPTCGPPSPEPQHGLTLGPP